MTGQPRFSVAVRRMIVFIARCCVQIMAMTIMKDHERLDLLKEIGGTKVYEERREESLKVMKETEGRRKRIEEVVSTSPVHSFCAAVTNAGHGDME